MSCVHRLGGIAGTVVHDSISKWHRASSHKSSTNMFFTTYIMLFTSRWHLWCLIRCVGMHCCHRNCQITLSGMYGSTYLKKSIILWQVNAHTPSISTGYTVSSVLYLQSWHPTLDHLPSYGNILFPAFQNARYTTYPALLRVSLPVQT